MVSLKLQSKIMLIGLLIVTIKAEQSQTKIAKGLQNAETTEKRSLSLLSNPAHDRPVESKPIYVTENPRPTSPLKKPTHPRHYQPKYQSEQSPHYPHIHSPMQAPHYPPQYPSMYPLQDPPQFIPIHLPQYHPQYSPIYPPMYQPMPPPYHFAPWWYTPEDSPHRPSKRPRPAHYNGDYGYYYVRPLAYLPTYPEPQGVTYAIVVSPTGKDQHHHRTQTSPPTTSEQPEEEYEKPIRKFTEARAPQSHNAPQLIYDRYLDDHLEELKLPRNRPIIQYRGVQEEQRNTENEDVMKEYPDNTADDDVVLQHPLHLMANKMALEQLPRNSGSQSIHPVILEALLKELIEKRGKRVREAEIYLRNYVSNRRK